MSVMQTAEHLEIGTLEAGLPLILQSPRQQGTLKLIVRRPEVNEREVVSEGKLSAEFGLSGDTWIKRRSKRTPDGSAHKDMQLTVMNSRTIALVAGTDDRWQLAGDQLFVDLDISIGNLPTGTRLAIGEAVIEITELPHTGCVKFQQRFGADAVKFVNSPRGKELRLRGANARVVKEGNIRTGDVVAKL
jgi:hypothetical protein